jgi:CRP-like cAMP-binding protein
MVEIHLFKSSPDAYEVEAGEALFTEHEPGDAMYAVIEGHVEVTLGGHVVQQVGPGGILGEMALIDASPRAATATATVTSRVARVDKKHFLFLAVMAERLRHANEARH